MLGKSDDKPEDPSSSSSSSVDVAVSNAVANGVVDRPFPEEKASDVDRGVQRTADVSDVTDAAAALVNGGSERNLSTTVVVNGIGNGLREDEEEEKDQVDDLGGGAGQVPADEGFTLVYEEDSPVPSASPTGAQQDATTVEFSEDRRQIPEAQGGASDGSISDRADEQQQLEQPQQEQEQQQLEQEQQQQQQLEQQQQQQQQPEQLPLTASSTTSDRERPRDVELVLPGKETGFLDGVVETEIAEEATVPEAFKTPKVSSEVVENEASDPKMASEEAPGTSVSITTRSGRRVVKPSSLTLDYYSRSPSACSKRSLTGSRSSSPDSVSSSVGRDNQDEDVDGSNAHVIEYNLGQLAWARLGSSAFWPCIVSKDPVQQTFTALVPGLKGLMRTYHVQFFGRVQRAWVKTTSIMAYEGVEKFGDSVGKDRSKKKAIPNKCSLVKWEAAVEELKTTVNMSFEERSEFALTRFNNMARLKRQRRQSDKGRCSSAASGETPLANDSFSDGSPPRKISRLTDEIDSLIKAIPADVLDQNRRKLKTGFKLFQIANAASLKNESVIEDDNSGSKQGTSEVDKLLTKRWSLLSAADRKYYQEQSLRLFREDPDGSNSVGSGVTPGRLTKDCGGDEGAVEEAGLENDCDENSLSPPKKRARLSSGALAARGSRAPLPVLQTSSKSRGNDRLGCSQQQVKASNEMIGIFKKASCCLVCEEVDKANSTTLKCKGCYRTFHDTCLKGDMLNESSTTSEQVEEWKCSDCLKGTQACMLCRAHSSDIEKCSFLGCGRYFHRTCLKQYNLWPQARYSETQLTCPGHICHTCASDNPKDPYMKYNTKLLKCIRCPTAYHSGNYCVAAGSVQLTMSQIICPKHFPPEGSAIGKKIDGGHHFNANWCFLCSKGGSLICCERCPASFHRECLHIEVEEDKFYCDNCESGRMPLYGEILWVKLGVYRWWPAQVIHPAKIPINVDRLPHHVGQFPIQFCGSNEYYWINQGRCFQYEEGDSDKNLYTTKSAARKNAFKKGLEEASELFREHMDEKNRRETANAARMIVQKHVRPPLYARIKSNKPFGDCPVYTADPLDQQMCECDPKNGEDPCGENSECLNRLLRCECRPSTCPSGERCQNQRFQRRKYPKLRVTRTSTRGWGLTVYEDIKVGEFLIEYVGELITMREFHQRIEGSRTRKEEHNYYYMTMDNNRMIDAGPKGNIARFMNHSCDPNCETQKWTVNGDTRVGIFALKDIPAGSELTFNYQFEAMGEVKQICLCGAKNCSGFIGEKPNRDLAIADSGGHGGADGGNGADTTAKKKKLKKATKVWDDLCFRCYEDGVLLMCDWKTCPKVYHLACLGREKMPREKWFCPWHHCVQCGKPAVSHCIHCPNAYCKLHDDVLVKHKELGTICDEHEDDIDDLITFYRQVDGGVSSLIPHPNYVVPPGPLAVELRQVENQEEPVAESASNSGENSNRIVHESEATVNCGPLEASEGREPADASVASVPNSNNEKGRRIYLCSIANCGWVGRPERLERHLARIHKFSTDQSRKMRQAAVRTQFNMIRAGSLEGKQSLKEPSLNRRRLAMKPPTNTTTVKGNVCPKCGMLLRGGFFKLKRHVRAVHPSYKLLDRAVMTTSVRLDDHKSPRSPPKDKPEGANKEECLLQSLKTPGPEETEEDDLLSRLSIKRSMGERLVTEEEKRISPLHSLCLQCGKYVHSSNCARHWRAMHSDKAYSPEKFRPNSAGNEDEIGSGDDGQHQKKLGRPIPIIASPEKLSLALSQSTSPRIEQEGPLAEAGLFRCNYPNCLFRSKFRRSVRRHQLRKCHLKDPGKKVTSVGDDGAHRTARRLKFKALNLIRNATKRSQTPSAGSPSKVPISKGRFFPCKFPDCPFRSVFKSSLKRHIRLWGHSLPGAAERAATAASSSNGFRPRAQRSSAHEGDSFSTSGNGAKVVPYAAAETESMASSEKPFRCDFPSCTFGTVFKSSLKRHKRLMGHQGDKGSCEEPAVVHPQPTERGNGVGGRDQNSCRRRRHPHNSQKTTVRLIKSKAAHFIQNSNSMKKRVVKRCALQARGGGGGEKVYVCKIEGCSFRSLYRSNVARHEKAHFKTVAAPSSSAAKDAASEVQSVDGAVLETNTTAVVVEEISVKCQENLAVDSKIEEEELKTEVET